MPNLADLKNKWFINFSGNSPLGGRHDGTNVANHTDNNTITVLDEGEGYMKEWHDLCNAPIGANQQIYHAGWRIDNIRTLGPTTGPASSEALTLLETANAGGTLTSIAMSNHVGNKNDPPLIRLGVTGGLTLAAKDDRYPAAGSNHQKFLVKKDGTNATALLGSIDVNIGRWGNQAHTLPGSGGSSGSGPAGITSLTHDLGLKITGPCVADIEHTYLERWNNTSFFSNSRRRGLNRYQSSPASNPPYIEVTPALITPTVSTYAGTGTTSIQTLHTYGIASALGSRYTWANVGEFTIWRSYLNAIQQASEYIYIEDQYFLPFGWPVCHSRPAGLARDTDIIFQLGEAIKRGVKVGVLVPDSDEDPGSSYIRYQRSVGLHYLDGLAAAHSGDFFVGCIYQGTDNIYVHSKLMIVDDEFALIGSANVNQRGMTHDGEIQLGIVDATTPVVKDLRKLLYAEHTGRTPASLDNPITAYNQYKADIAASHHRLRPFSTAAPGAVPTGHANLINNIIDPYAGPSGIR